MCSLLPAASSQSSAYRDNTTLPATTTHPYRGVPSSLNLMQSDVMKRCPRPAPGPTMGHG
jgi:hypothetical protein